MSVAVLWNQQYELKASSNLSYSLMESLPGVACIFDSSGTIRRWNTNFPGYLPSEMLGKSIISTGAPESLEAIRDAMKETLEHGKEPYRTWYRLAAETGLRAGELCGLTADDIDLERGMLQVRQSAWRGKLGDPKTDESIRVVELSPQACGHLRKFLESWHPNQRRLIFATRTGTPWDQNLLLKRKFRPLFRELSIDVPRGNDFHSFRHANATLMSSFGASQKLRQQRLGHADGSPVTETIYTHVISEDGKRIAAQLGNAVWGVLDAIGRKNENGSEGASSKPFLIN